MLPINQKCDSINAYFSDPKLFEIYTNFDRDMHSSIGATGVHQCYCSTVPFWKASLD